MMLSIMIAILLINILVLFFIFKRNTGATDLLQSQLETLLVTNNAKLEAPQREIQISLMDRLSDNQQKLSSALLDFKSQLIQEERQNFENLAKSMEARLDKMDRKVQESLHEGLDKTNKSFIDLMQRLAKIDEAQKKIETLSMNVVSLQDVLTDKKTRGIFGEVQLKNLLENVFGENQKQVFSLQAKLSNETMVDALLTLPEPVGKVAVDSKFPLENYKRMIDRNLAEDQRVLANKNFVADLKRHIDAIADKYIIKNETADQAILFLPAEAIFAEIHAYHDQIVDYAHKRRVWISSPTTFMATLTSLQTVLTNIERSKYMVIIQQELNRLGDDFGRFEARFDDLAKHIKNVSSDVDKIHISSQKISGRFKKILDVDLEPRIEHES
jgi:DNA recombination protein RmuC